MDMKKILIITPHLSTGGAPQVTLNKIKLLKDDCIIKCVEYSFIAWNYVIQRNPLENMLLDNFHSLGDNKSELINILKDFNPDVVSMEEFPEFFMDDNITKEIYKEDRRYTIFETTHDSSFPVTSKRYFPDKFIFVSAFNAFRYSIFDIPYEIIEYPVDVKIKNQKENQEKLDLSSDWKHVVNVGLFTARKNQKYLFEIAEYLKNYKIKFHFIGNQADNFKDYWEPLITNKPKNAIIWGERNDVDSFIQASDVFFFSSKGDRNNKELNPIAIKEALEYKIPMMMYNLEVYCGKYNDEKSITFLTGDLKQDSENLLNILGVEVDDSLTSHINDDEVIIISTYPDTIKRKNLTIECIESFKQLGRKIILVSHYPVPNEIHEMADYYVFDSNNLMIPHSYYTHFYNNTNQYNAQININGLSNSNQSLAAHMNFMNGAKLAKDIGATKFMIITYDVILNDLDIPLIEKYFNKLTTWNCCLSYMDNGIETTSMVFKTSYFLNTFLDITDEVTFNNHCSELKCHNFLENYYMKILEGKENLWIEHNNQKTILPNSGLGVSSNSEYYSILPVNETKNKWVFYFYTYNIDNRRLELSINKSGKNIFKDSIIISERKSDLVSDRAKYFKHIDYDGEPIEIVISFYDGDNLHKTETYELNDITIHEYYNNGFFKENNQSLISNIESPKYNIKILHLQTTINDVREQLSRESLQKLNDFGFNYVLHKNVPYTSLPPSHNCLRPHNVRLEKYDNIDDPEYGNALTPAHYGCFDSFKLGILSEFDKELDFLIVCEGDCIIEVPTEEFVNKVNMVCEIINNEDISYFSFGDTKTLDFGWHQSNEIRKIPNQDLLFITDKIIGLQCVMFPIKTREYLTNKLRTEKWDCMDTFFNIIFSNKNMGILKNRITTQADGFSLIDKELKTFIK
jgi:hypothetical protein